MEAMEVGSPSEIDSVTYSDAQWATCRRGLEMLERLMTLGHHLQGVMIKDYLRGLEALEGALAIMMAKVLDLGASTNILEEVGARIGAEDSKGNTILHTVANQSNADKVRLILQTERKLNVRTDFSGFAALHVSARAGSLNALKVLLKYGANPMWREPSGNTALHLSVEGGHLKCAEVLLEVDAPVDAQNSAGETPLFAASKAGHLHCVNLLIKKAASVNLETRNGQIALHAAAAHGRSDCINALLKAGIDVNKADNQKWTPLLSAVEGGCNVQGIRMLLTAKANVNAKTEDGKTPLHICAAKGTSELLQALLQHDPIPNLGERDREGRTALQTATANKHSKCIELLKGAEEKYKAMRD